MTKKTEWQLEQEKQDNLRQKAMKSLTKEQLMAINKAYKSIKDALCNVREIEDLYLSDVRNLDTAMWKLKHQFNIADED